MKTLEEPPKYAVFILATTEVHKLPATILSRCMRFDFKLVSVEDLSQLLKKVLTAEYVSFDENSINLIARAGEGSVRDTLSIADRCVSFGGNNLTSKAVVEILGATEKQNLIDIADAILHKTVGDALEILDQVLSGGKSPLVLSKDLVYYFRDLLIINALKVKADSMIIANPDDYKNMKLQATDENYFKIAKAIELLSSVEADLRYSAQPRIVLETCIIKFFAQKSLEERVAQLEKMLASGKFVGTAQNLEEPKQEPKSSENVSFEQTDEIKTTQVQASPDTAPIMKTSNSSQSTDRLLGQLLNYLREQKLMSLLMACRQINKITLDGDVAVLYIRDQSAIAMINSEKYSPIISEFFHKSSLKWRIYIGETQGQTGQVGDLATRLGGKLEIK